MTTIVYAASPSQSEGELLVLAALKRLPGIVSACQTDGNSRKDWEGVDIEVETDPLVYPQGDRRVYLQVKGARSQLVARQFKLVHGTERIVVLKVCAEKLNFAPGFLEYLLRYVLERPVPQLKDTAQFQKFFNDLCNMVELLRRGHLKAFEYLGDMYFSVTLGDSKCVCVRWDPKARFDLNAMRYPTQPRKKQKSVAAMPSAQTNVCFDTPQAAQLRLALCQLARNGDLVGFSRWVLIGSLTSYSAFSVHANRLVFPQAPVRIKLVPCLENDELSTRLDLQGRKAAVVVCDRPLEMIVAQVKAIMGKPPGFL